MDCSILFVLKHFRWVIGRWSLGNPFQVSAYEIFLKVEILAMQKNFHLVGTWEPHCVGKNLRQCCIKDFPFEFVVLLLNQLDLWFRTQVRCFEAPSPDQDLLKREWFRLGIEMS